MAESVGPVAGPVRRAHEQAHSPVRRARDSSAVNHYQLLGIDADATSDEIRRAYRARAKAAHPDAGGDPAAFRQLLIAYETLIRADRRRDYDDQQGIRVEPRGVPDGGQRDAGWDGRRGEFSGDVSFPAWMSGITDEQWIPPPPDESALEDPERVAAERAAARDRPATERRADVAWWWPHRAIGRPAVDGDLLVVGGARALAVIDGRDGHEIGRLPFERALVAAPLLADDLAVVWTDDGSVHGIGRDQLQARWTTEIGPPAPGGMAVASAGRRGSVVLVARADARLAAVRVDSGQVRWATKLAAPATHAPAVDDDLAVVVSGGRTVEAIDPRTGKHRWRIHLRNPVHLPPQILGYSVWLAGGGPPGALVRLDAATGAVEGTYGAGDALGGLVSDGRSLFATAAGPARLLELDERGRISLAVDTTRVCAEPTVTPSFAYLTDPNGRVLTVDRVRQRITAISTVLFEPVGAPLLTGRNVALLERDGHLWAITRPEEQLAPGD
jgi:hypothetical protein